MKKVTALARKLRRSFSSVVTDEAADMLIAQDEEIQRLRQRIKELEDNDEYVRQSLAWI